MSELMQAEYLYKLPITFATISQCFSPWEIQKGKNYYSLNRVLKIEVLSENQVIAFVQGTRRSPYRVEIWIDQEDSTSFSIEGSCSCPVGYDCKHVVASLFKLLENIKNHSTNILLNEIDPIVAEKKHNELWDNWLRSTVLAQKLISSNEVKKQVNEPYAVVYLLNINESYVNPFLIVRIKVVRCLKKGGFGTTKDFKPGSITHERYLSEQDEDIYHNLQVIVKGQHQYHYTEGFKLTGKKASAILKKILQTGRAYWQNINSPPLRLAEKRKAKLIWEKSEQGVQQLSLTHDGHTLICLPVSAGWYVDSLKSTCGPLNLPISSEMMMKFLQMPPITPEKTKDITKLLRQHFPEVPIPPLNEFTFLEMKNSTLKPKLRLYGAKLIQVIDSKALMLMLKKPQSCVLNNIMALCDITFSYDGIEVSSNNQRQSLLKINKDQVIKIIRDKEKEAQYLDQLTNIDCNPIYHYYATWHVNAIYQHAYAFSKELTHQGLVGFIANELNQLKLCGWIIDIEDSFPVNFVDSSDEWFTEIENSDYDWFGLTLGIVIDGKKINLLPVLAELLLNLQLTSTEIETWSDEKLKIPVTLPDGRITCLPTFRIKKILQILIELYNPHTLDKDKKLRLSKLRALDLLSLEKTFSSVKHRWLGADKMRHYAKRLANFNHPNKVDLPPNFQATLRPYQYDGLCWLQFLREYKLGGILADDMGLGKTVQFLANLLVEKVAKRINLPCLLIVPTTLVSNWVAEARRFAPELSVLVIHGDDRANQFSNIDTHDIVVTTYPLILRDKNIYLDKQFYYLVLDEAQYIKNAKTKVYQTILQLTAEHRLCLTGTPMENHLGECWALFNQVIPGLLGNRKLFTKLFKTPIAKQNNRDRQKQLSERIKPFLLRRTKNEVLQELPDKNIIVKEIDLYDEQVDLYEVVRLSMQEKIINIVNQQGIARSHIVILDALLKLRQICCDPRLLSIDAAKKVKRSAKLDYLSDMLSNLVEEGRQILVYSSFVKMLALIEEELNERKIPFVKLTGNTKDRKTPVELFQNSQVPIFLISLKAGGVGLNLTAADTVIHYDPWWNPAAEDQATDRAHRIGQKKTIFVYKMICRSTVEQSILSMQNKKRKLLDGLLSQATHTKFSLTKEDLDVLFKPLDERSFYYEKN